MIENFLCTALVFYLAAAISLFTVPPILAMAFQGVEGLKDIWYDIKDKTYFTDIVIPVFLQVTVVLIIIFLIKMLIYNITT